MNATEELCQAVGDIRRFIVALPQADFVEKAWGPREVLAHLVFWIESYVTQVDALLAGETPLLLQGRFDDLNAQAVQASRGVSVEELLRRHQAACEHLCQVARTHDPESIVFVLKKGSSFRRSLPQYLSAEASHIRSHQRILERQVDRAYMGEIEKLKETVDAFCQFVQELPDADLVEQEWGPMEVLAHLVFWHERHVAQIESILAQEPFAGPEGRPKDLNAYAVKAGRSQPVGELVHRLQVADERLRSFGRTLDPQDVVLEVQSHLHTLEGAIARIEAHIRNHHRRLMRQINGQMVKREENSR
jgi:hypothetical protein